MEVLALIPARGGSKGIPRKNVRPLGGKPLLAYTVEHARATPGVTRVAVSTDDDEIAAVAAACGAEVIWRPADLSGDTASSESALLHALEVLRTREGYRPDVVAFLQATSPLRRPEALAEALDLFHREGADSLFSAGPMHGFVWRVEPDGPASFNYDYRRRPRRQDAPEDVVENGSFYLTKTDLLETTGNRLGGRIAVYRMSATESFQVDEPEDLALLAHLLRLRGGEAAVPDLRGIRLLVLDFDGVLTDNRVLVDQDGREAVWCHRGDGMGIERLRGAGLEVMILSTEVNPVVAARSRKLRLECIHGSRDKLANLREIVAARGLTAESVAFVGNDLNDLTCLQWVGLPIAVADAEPEVRAAARWVTQRPGGYGAVREVADAFLRQRADVPTSPQPDGARAAEAARP